MDMVGGILFEVLVSVQDVAHIVRRERMEHEENCYPPLAEAEGWDR
jgi:hypothetical protein